MFQQKDQWPFPIYYGSCGRIIVESYEGKTLNYYFDHPFVYRVYYKEYLKNFFRNK